MFHSLEHIFLISSQKISIQKEKRSYGEETLDLIVCELLKQEGVLVSKFSG